MPRARSEWKPVRLDERGQPVAIEKAGVGDVYVWVQDWTGLSEKQIKSRHPKRYVLTDELDRKIPYKEFTHYIPSPWCKGENPNGSERSDAQVVRLLISEVRKFKIRKGIGNVLVGQDGSEITISRKKNLSDFWDDYVANMRTIVSRKTGKLIPKQTIVNRGHAFKLYLEICGDHPITDFPPNVAEDFMLKAQATSRVDTRYKTKKLKRLSVNTIRLRVVVLNQFFQWCLRKEFVQKVPTLEMPTRDKSKEPPTPTIAERNMVETELKKLVVKWGSVKPHFSIRRRISREVQYRNLLRFYMLIDYGAMRRSEVWALKRENIDLDERKIHIIEKEGEDAGTNMRGKPFQVSFTPKSGRPDFVIIDDYLYKFLVEDEELRNPEEQWYIDKGDGSNYYSNPMQLSDAMSKFLKKLGIHVVGQANHWFRRARNMDVVEENQDHGKHHLRHSNMITNETYYQTHKKPDNLIDSLNKSNEKRHKLN
nr:Integrase (XerC) [uncultured Mediterranean phage uvMED]